MRIVVRYADRCPRVIETAGESMLTSDAALKSEDWSGALQPQPMVATHLRVRTDVAAGGGPLLVELCCYSSALDRYVLDRPTQVSDFGTTVEAHFTRTHVFRVLMAVTAEDMEGAVDVRSEGVWLHRIGDRLLDLSGYSLFEEELLSATEIGSKPLWRRVLKVHERLELLHPELEKQEISRLYGMDNTLLDYACAVRGEVRLDSAEYPCGAGENIEAAKKQQDFDGEHHEEGRGGWASKRSDFDDDPFSLLRREDKDWLDSLFG